MKKIRRGDEVEVISGKNKGQRGTVRINLVDNDKVVVEGVNIVIKHIKRGRARQAGRVEVEAPMPVSKVKLVCPSCGKPTRVGVHTGDDGKNVRYCKACEKDIPRPEA
jgi:large subunit ribosomal protein L24